MVKTRVGGAWKHKVHKAHLFDVAQALKNRLINNGLQVSNNFIIQLHDPVDCIIYKHLIVPKIRVPLYYSTLWPS